LKVRTGMPAHYASIPHLPDWCEPSWLPRFRGHR